MPLFSGLAEGEDSLLARRFAEREAFTVSADGTALAAHELPARIAAASARAMLAQAAASRWGIAGVFIGGILGMFFVPFGLILGPLIGGISFELIFAKKQLHPAAKSAWGSLLGTGVGLVLRLIVALGMVATFFLDALVW